MKLRYILSIERGSLNSFMRKLKLTGMSEENVTQLLIKRRKKALSNGLFSKAKIWEKIDKKQEERRRKSEHEQEKRDQNELLYNQTRKISESSKELNEVRKDLNEVKKEVMELKTDVQRIIQHLSSEVLLDRGSTYM